MRPSRHSPRLTTVGLLGLLIAAPVSAVGIPGHLKCYTIRDPVVRLKGIVDIETVPFGVDPGCTVSKTKLYCESATAVIQRVTNRRTGDPITLVPIAGDPAPDDRVCYRMKCPRRPGVQDLTDEFGAGRTVNLVKTLFLCTAAVKGTAYCGDGTVAGNEACDGADLASATCQSLGFASGTLACDATCRFDTRGCIATTVPGCGNDVREGVEQCDGTDLGGATCVTRGFPFGTLGCTSGCAFDTNGCSGGMFPATGQKECWDMVIGVSTTPCPNTGQDGESQAGAELTYIDNGDGTITDANTGLMWEKLADDGSVHDQDDTYTWANAVALKIASLNGQAFAGHTDWRVPNAKELQSIVNYQYWDPAVSPAFATNCTGGCTVATCSCTGRFGYYWSSTFWVISGVTPIGPSMWCVDYSDGFLQICPVGETYYVRAVRGNVVSAR